MPILQVLGVGVALSPIDEALVVQATLFKGTMSHPSFFLGCGSLSSTPYPPMGINANKKVIKFYQGKMMCAFSKPIRSKTASETKTPNTFGGAHSSIQFRD